MNKYETLLDDGSLFISLGEHRWQDAGMPGLSKCLCGLFRRYDKHTDNYWYTLKEPTKEMN